MRQYIHIAVEGKKSICVPVYIHIDSTDSEWWTKRQRSIKPEIVRILTENIKDIELKYVEFTGGASKGGATGLVNAGNPIHSSMVLSFSHAPPPSKLEGSDQCLIAYAVSPNSKYSLLTVHPDDNMLQENSISSFIVSCWVYPPDAEERYPHKVLPIFS